MEGLSKEGLSFFACAPNAHWEFEYKKILFTLIGYKLWL